MVQSIISHQTFILNDLIFHFVNAAWVFHYPYYRSVHIHMGTLL